MITEYYDNEPVIEYPDATATIYDGSIINVDFWSPDGKTVETQFNIPIEDIVKTWKETIEKTIDKDNIYLAILEINKLKDYIVDMERFLLNVVIGGYCPLHSNEKLKKDIIIEDEILKDIKNDCSDSFKEDFLKIIKNAYNNDYSDSFKGKF
jgi:hypothetical protein